ncbi:MAG: arsenate reductase ArsC [Ignavibacteriales bacterium]|nr:arsenate reductase ArsC [Ignavibacteriales bacterium]
MNQKKRILFLCIANSCRSQMAEGLVRHYLGDYFYVESAGIIATIVNPNAIKVMDELGIDISGHRSKDLSEFNEHNFDIIITLCDEGDALCPEWFGGGEKVHIGFSDPIRAKGSEEEVLKVFRSVRDDMKKKLMSFLQTKI